MTEEHEMKLSILQKKEILLDLQIALAREELDQMRESLLFFSLITGYFFISVKDCRRFKVYFLFKHCQMKCKYI